MSLLRFHLLLYSAFKTSVLYLILLTITRSTYGIDGGSRYSSGGSKQTGIYLLHQRTTPIHPVVLKQNNGFVLGTQAL
ncbi:hypothetical protein V8C40DRAFT_268309 [Trichoderma camerunense]